MKRLLLGPALLLPLLTLGYCHHTTKVVPEVPAVVRHLDDTFNQFKPTPPPKIIPTVPHRAAKHRHVVVKHKHTQVKPPVPLAPPVAPEETPVRPGCLFPFSLVPFCKAGVP